MERFVEGKSPESCLIQRQHLLQLRKSLSCIFFEAGGILGAGGEPTQHVYCILKPFPRHLLLATSSDKMLS